MMLLGIILGFLAGAVIFLPNIKRMKSYFYRKELVNLYIAGKVRQLAGEQKIDLGLEYENLKKWVKKKRMYDMELDETIEEDLQDKITEVEKPKK